MAVYKGPNIVTENLVFGFDLNSRFFNGKPTENIISESGYNFTQLSTYPNLVATQIVDVESFSGYACEMEILDLSINSSAIIRFGDDTNIPTSGDYYVTVYAKSEINDNSIKPAVYSGVGWYVLSPLYDDNEYLTNKYRRFGASISLGTGSGGPNPGFSMTYSNTNKSVGQKTKWHSAQLEQNQYPTPFTKDVRTSTEVIEDIKGNVVIDTSNISFDSNGLPYFDGTAGINGSWPTELNIVDSTTPRTWEAFVKPY